MFSASKSGQYPGYLISRSVRLRSSASAYFNRTPGSSSNRQVWTYSAWVKYSVADNSAFNAPILWASGTGGTTGIAFAQSSNTPHRVYVYNAGSNIETTQVLRDPSGWYHLVAVIDNTQATASNRTKLYINGTLVTALTTANYPAQNANGSINEATEHNIGRQVGLSRYFDGYLTEINFIDGQALTPSSFGVTNAYGVWSPIKYNGTYGTNGFYLNFSDNSGATATTIGKDSSGNGNNWTPNNISVTAGSTYDSMLDVPTLWGDGGNGRGNYCVMNPLKLQANMRLTNGNLDVSSVDAGSAYGAFGSIVMDSGKWYAEFLVNTSTGQYPNIGIGDLSKNPNTNEGFYGTKGVSYNRDGTVYRDGSLLGTFSTFTNGDVISVAFDPANSRVYFAKNNTWINSGDPANGTGFFTVNAAVQGYVFGGAVYQPASFSCNFGQRPFAYTPPSGFKALNTLNLPEPTIKKGNAYFDATTYTGTGANQSIVNSGGMQPDLVWLKTRNTVSSNLLYDSSRGVLNYLSSNQTAAEASLANSLTAFNSNGFSLGSDGNVNGNGTTFVGWQWKEGATQGFDIVTYSGSGGTQNVAHSLGVAPRMMIVKSRSTAGTAWPVYHASLGNTQVVTLNTTSATATVGIWGNTTPTSSVFTVSDAGATNGDTNFSGRTYVAYLFAEVAGFSKFGSYTGNGSADGPFVFCGFRPRFVMVKRTDTVESWNIIDTARDSYNQSGLNLYPNLSNAESANNYCDVLSNGFKLRNTWAGANASGGNYIYAAFAENPFKYALAR